MESDNLYSCYECKEKKLQKHRGCPELGLRHPGIYYQYGNEAVEHCLSNKVTADSISFIQEHGFLEVGILPEGGGLNDQWEKDMGAFSIVADEKRKYFEKNKGH